MKIAIAGYGVEGKANYEFFRGHGDITIADERTAIDDLPEGVATILGEGCFAKLQDFDVVLRTASLPPSKIVTNGTIWSATNEFLAKCPAPIIGVTGTKGKGTTCTLIASILRAAGRTVHLVGNIGVPALSVLPTIKPDDIVVFELSSFQLWDVSRSPHVAVVLMVEPDHLDVHASFEEYVGAKANIVRYQQPNDIVIYHPANIYSSEIAALSFALKKMRYQTPEAAHVDGDNIVISEQIICSVKDVLLMGEYNLQNVCAAITASWVYTQDVTAIAGAVRSFKGLEHRMEFVGTKRGVSYYNDSYSSAPTAAIAAISAFSTSVILIVGGFERGIDLTPLADAIVKANHLKKVIIIGQVRERLALLLRQKQFNNFQIVEATDMTAVVQAAVRHAAPGDAVVLSPGCASFDMFKDFTDRGNQFKQVVGAMGE